MASRTVKKLISYALLLACLSLCPASTLLAGPYDRQGSAERFLAPIDENLGLLLGIEETRRFTAAFPGCSDTNKKEFAFESCAFLSYFKDQAEPLSPAPFRLIKSKVIYFGETHIYQGSKTALIQLLPTLHESGFDHLGLEMFNSSQQPALDAYAKGEISLPEITMELEKTWTYNSTQYAKILETAKNLGIRIVALDIRDDALSHPVFALTLHHRDLHMAAKIAEALALNPKAKLVAFTGSLHAACAWNLKGGLPSQPEILQKEFQLSSSCFTIEQKMKGGLFTEAAKAAGQSGNLFVPLDRGSGYFDGALLID